MTSNSNAVAELHGEVVPMSRAEHDRMANAIRALAMDAVEQAKSGHPGLPMGAADIATVLFTQFLKFDPADPRWPGRCGLPAPVSREHPTKPQLAVRS